MSRLFLSALISVAVFSAKCTVAADISTLEKECNEGRGKSCAEAGVFYENSERPDLKKAEQMYLSGCDLDDMFSCGALLYLPDCNENATANTALSESKSDSVAKNNKGSINDLIETFNKRNSSTDLKHLYLSISDYCVTGDSKACLYTGIMNSYGLGTKRNLKKAVSYYESACDGNISKACYNQGFMYEYGKGTVKSVKTALTLFERGCSLNDGKACNSAGYLYEFGKGLKQNKGTAAKYFEKGCELNDGSSCRNRAWLYVKGKGRYHSEDKAFSYFLKGCSLNDAKSCSSVGYSYLHGSGTEKDLNKARKYYKIACTKGHKKSCSFK